MSSYEAYARKSTELLIKNLGFTEDSVQTVPVIIKNHSVANACFKNVDEQVQLHGGLAIRGWLLSHTIQSKLFRCFVEAIPYAVWLDEEDNLIDVTPHPDNHIKSTFIVDPTRPYGVRVDNVRVAYKDKDNEYIKRFFRLKSIVFEFMTTCEEQNQGGTQFNNEQSLLYKELVQREVELERLYIDSKEPTKIVLSKWDQDTTKSYAQVLHLDMNQLGARIDSLNSILNPESKITLSTEALERFNELEKNPPKPTEDMLKLGELPKFETR